MGRKPGSRSHDYDEKRAELARRVFRCLAAGKGPTLNAMADFTGVSRPTLRHYFRDREGAVRTALELAARVGATRFGPIAELEGESAHDVVREALEYFVAAWRNHGIGRLHRVGLKEGIDDPVNGQVYLDHALEPALHAFATLFDRLQARGQLAPGDARARAFAAVGPIHLAMVHQTALGGATEHPVDVRALIDELAAQLSAPRTAAPPPSDPSDG